MKVAVIGGGSTYTPELVNGFLERTSSLPVTELWLMDIDPARLNIVGGFAQRMAEARGKPFKVVLSQDQRAAVQGASYVITQLRVGQMPARVADEYLGLRHGLIGQETTGVGGMAKAMRTIPVTAPAGRTAASYCLMTVPSRRRMTPHPPFRLPRGPSDRNGCFAASFSSISIPHPGASLA